MPTTRLRLSVLDQSPANGLETAHDALQNTIKLAQKAEEWGYHRVWVTEHHGSNRNMGSAPEVLVSHLLAKTNRIRVGSGGVMLQHYSPYKVAENFNVLASLAPGRVDLGIGGGPGGMPKTTRALQMDTGYGSKPLPEKLDELERFLHNRLDQDHPLYGLTANPIPPRPADLFLLGTTPSSAELAAQRAMPYVFALFLNSDEAVMREAIDTYRGRFDHGKGAEPQAMLALPVMVADTDEEAQGYASKIKVFRIQMDSGRTLTVFSREAAEEFLSQSPEKGSITAHDGNVIHGSPETVRQQLEDVQRSYQVDEVFVVTAIRDFPKRLHSYELLAETMIKAHVS
jgi:luciferase family oxidoreductase group 1